MKVLAVLCAFLLAGASANPIVVDVEEGDFYAFTITAAAHEIASCILKTPAGSRLEFVPGVTSQLGDRYTLQPISALPACSILVTGLQRSDTGLWEISFVSTTGDSSSSSFQLNVAGDVEAGNTDTPEDVTEESTETSTQENDIIEWFDTVQFPTRIDQIIDISLPRIHHEEECFIHTHKGEIINALDIQIEGVTFYRSNSHFVSCRITIGPMVEDLLGDWTICGKHTENNRVLERCQPAKIYWNSVNNPGAEWHTDVRDEFNHPVHFDSTLSPVVIGSGEVVACHIVTREMEDLLVTPNSQYPYINVTMADSTCRFDIGPISILHLGNWVIYGLFTNSIEGLHEVRLPFSMSLYDKENPYNQAFNTTVLDPVTRTVNMGNTINVEVAGVGQVESCYFETPDDVLYTMGLDYNFDGASFVNEDDGSVACRVAIGPFTSNLLGSWKIIGKFSNNGIFTKVEQVFHVIKEDPENPIQEDRTVTYLAAQSVHTEMGLSNEFVIPSHEFIYGESCHIRTPNGLQYKLIEGFNIVPGVKFIQDSDVECGVILSVVSEDVVGEWTLIARARHHSEPIERRLPITIYVEVNNEPENSLTPGASTTTLSLVRDRSVSQFVGPEDSIYCRMEDPQGVVTLDSFGRCHITLHNVGLEHHGTWKMIVATPGKVVAEEHHLVVSVIESEGKPVVSTHVAQNKPIVTIACSVQPASEVTGCKFRDPHGKILIAASGLSEDRYSFFGNGASIVSGVLTHECGIQITNPLVSDLGLWRCAIETATDTYYGHMPVLCPWALSQPEVAAVVQQEPILKASRSLVSVLEEDPAVLSCSVEASIRYCYFRSANGTTFTVSPGMSSSSMEYVGEGFDAGECGIKFQGMHATDSGRWSCHVGLIGDHEEQRDQFQLTVHERIRVNHYNTHGNVMTVEGVVHEGRALEYCRFVRIDGFGFTTDNMPSQYTLTGILSNGECQFTARNPTMLDLHPWTIAAKIRGQDVEIAKDTMESILIGGSVPEESRPEQIIIYRNNGMAIFMYVFMSLLLVSVIVGGLLGPKKNRHWTSQRASALRSSLTNSFRKQQQQQQEHNPAPQYTA